MKLQLISPQRIRPNPEQPRKSFDEDALHTLRVSMRAVGQLQPICVRPIKDASPDDVVAYELIDGERRWRAAMMEGSDISELSAIVRDIDDDEQYLQSCVHNFGRMDHTPYEEIQMVRHLRIELGFTQNMIANALCKSQTWVNQRLLAWDRLDEQVMHVLKEGGLPISVATKLAKLVPSEQVTQMHNYLNGGSVTTVDIAVREATDRGVVQGGVRKPDLTDDRRYIEVSVQTFCNRFKRLEVMGRARIMEAARSIDPDERAVMVHDLTRSAKQIVELLTALQLKE